MYLLYTGSRLLPVYYDKKIFEFIEKEDSVFQKKIIKTATTFKIFQKMYRSNDFKLIFRCSGFRDFTCLVAKQIFELKYLVSMSAMSVVNFYVFLGDNNSLIRSKK